MTLKDSNIHSMKLTKVNVIVCHVLKIYTWT